MVGKESKKEVEGVAKWVKDLAGQGPRPLKEGEVDVYGLSPEAAAAKIAEAKEAESKAAESKAAEPQAKPSEVTSVQGAVESNAKTLSEPESQPISTPPGEATGSPPGEVTATPPGEAKKVESTVESQPIATQPSSSVSPPPLGETISPLPQQAFSLASEIERNAQIAATISQELTAASSKQGNLGTLDSALSMSSFSAETTGALVLNTMLAQPATVAVSKFVEGAKPGLVRVPVTVLSVTGYNFITKDSGESRVGLTLLATSGNSVYDGTQPRKGLDITQYSMGIPNPPNVVASLPAPPFFAVFELAIQKKNLKLVNFYLQSAIVTRYQDLQNQFKGGS